MTSRTAPPSEERDRPSAEGLPVGRCLGGGRRHGCAILGLVYVKHDEEKLPAAVFSTVGALTAANIFIAVLCT